MCQYKKKLDNTVRKKRKKNTDFSILSKVNYLLVN